MLTYGMFEGANSKMIIHSPRPIKKLARLYFICALISFTIISFNPGLAQNTEEEKDPEISYKNGLMLMERKNYGAARREFEACLSGAHVEAIHADAEYYRAYCAVNLFNDDGEKLMENFIHNNPCPLTPASKFPQSRRSSPPGPK